MMLTEDEIQFFDTNGYLILKSIIPSAECVRFDQDVIQPALQRHANLHEDRPDTWSIKTNPHLLKYVNDNSAGNGNGNGIPLGVMVHDSNNKENNCDPIETEDSYWAALFDNERLIGVLDELHNIPLPVSVRSESVTETKTETETETEGGEKVANPEESRHRRWMFLHPGSVGWIHVRLPTSLSDLNPDCKETLELELGHSNVNNDNGDNDNDDNDDNDDDDDDNNDADNSFYIPTGEQSWHVDGGHFSPHCVTSLEQSVVLLPMIRNVAPNGGGNTVLLSGSHKTIAQRLHEHSHEYLHEHKHGEKGDGNGIDKHVLNAYCEELSKTWPRDNIVEAAPCQAGDLLVLHPFLVHSAGRNTRKVPAPVPVDMLKNKSKSSNNDASLSSSPVDYFRLTFNIGTRWVESETLSIFDNGKRSNSSILESIIAKSILCSSTTTSTSTTTNTNKILETRKH